MHLGCKTPQDVMAAISEHGIEMVDIKFTDLFGQWQHFSIPVEHFDAESAFEEGLGFDGSSIRGFKTIESSDMNLLADPTTALIDTMCAVPTLSLVCNVYEPITNEPFSRDPRYVAQRAVEYMKSTGIADTVYMGPEAEFFIFDEVYYHTNQFSAGYGVDSGEGIWNSGAPGLGHQIGYKGGYFPVAPYDTLQDLRTEMVREMLNAGIEVEVHHHEVATAGQCEIDMRFAPLVQMADQVQLYKYIVKNVAKRHGKTATFMPKPLFQDNGSGMHTHQSLWKNGEPLFAGDGYAGLSQLALWYIGGLLKHINSLLAFAAPTTNSYRRLVPGYEAPVVIAYSARNRSAACRIPVYSQSPKAKRIEFRCPDPAANPYLAFAAMLMAGLDGIKNQIDPGDPAEIDLFEEDALKRVPMVKGSLGEVLTELEKDHEFLLEGGVFTEDLIETYISHKRVADVDAVRLRPHPHEFVMYYGI
ncbi:type I glutamate--ammonia ligase [Litorilinea aerophila]|uniref:Glutamine synthetase n=1 Tax=Litorilinea aerophila TaxID=1204385 RepID=A0A540VI15_9CHLR|nr:type I glutamate--ammonia ligase [Litorilinea aerophila]MCC9076046.1 type I glutamate--ammonia ligase [Litorilinea aerophila]